MFQPSLTATRDGTRALSLGDALGRQDASHPPSHSPAKRSQNEDRRCRFCYNSPMRDDNTMQLGGPMSMPQLTELLSAQAGRPVIDATGIDGSFNIDLKFAPDDFDASKKGVIP